ncbi:MAG: SMR domain protein [Gammaproteobacteria bacterium]|jgi:DNA-nicking Smr family endonuclease|nr:SMR domain protein [Gammaproteobacteria bacterium]
MKSENKNREKEMFRRAMSDVTPLKSTNRIDPPSKKTFPRELQLEKDDQAVMDKLLAGDEDTVELENGEELLYLKPGYQKRVLRRLRRGYYSVEDTIDLHYMDVPTAKQVLRDFLERASQRQFGCVRVIHGKGLRSRNLPRLKMMTNKVLRNHALVVAFASSRPVSGGTGATDILLSAKPVKTR